MTKLLCLLAFPEIVVNQRHQRINSGLFIGTIGQKLHFGALAGGQHRSVYVCEQLGKHFREHYRNVQVRHSELPHLQARGEI